MLRGLVCRREDVAEEKDLLVRQTIRNFNRADIRIGDTQVFSLAAGKATSYVGEAKQAGKGIAERLSLHFTIGVCAFTATPVTPLALPAFPTANREWHNDAVANLQL